MAQVLQSPEGAPRGRPQANIYTVILIVAILALGTAIGFVLYNLLSPIPDGYGLDFGALFDPPEVPKPGSLLGG